MNAKYVINSVYFSPLNLFTPIVCIVVTFQKSGISSWALKRIFATKVQLHYESKQE